MIFESSIFNRDSNSFYNYKNYLFLILTNLKYIFVYRIDSNKAGYSSTAINMVDDKPNKRMLTLITCSAHGKTRRIAQGTLINIIDYNTSPTWVKKGFSLDSNYKAYF